MVFAEKDSFDSIAACLPLTLAPGLAAILQSPTPPSIKFFRELSDAPSWVSWGVYAVCMEKVGARPRVYVGSGTSEKNGARSRLLKYHPEGGTLPRLVVKAFKEGFEVTGRGVLCSTPNPPAGLLPRGRAYFLTLEAAFAHIFYAIIPYVTDKYIEHLLPWKREDIEWDPLCSHSPLNESVKADLSLTKEELELAAAMQAVHERERNRKYYLKQRAENLEALLAQALEATRKYVKNNLEKVKEIGKRSKDKARAEKKYNCDDCDVPFASQAALEQHFTTKTHKNKVAGIKPTARALQNAASRARASASGRFFCKPCQKPFQSNYALQHHKTSGRHLKKVAQQQQSS